MATAIMTDTNSGFTPQEAEASGVYLLLMPFMIDGKEFYEGKDLSLDMFYEKLGAGTKISTSQPAPADVLAMWDAILADGYDDIVYIPMSSGLSSSCYSAKGLASDYQGKVEVVDNHRISVTMKQSVWDALTLVKAGENAKTIRTMLEDNAYEASIYISLDTLKYLQQGGRVTAAGAAVGSVLNIKPVLTIQGGKLDAFAKARGMKAAKKSMLKAMSDDIKGRFAALYEQKKLQLLLSYSYISDEVLAEWKDEIEGYFPDMELICDPLSMSIGCHIGAGALAIAVCRIE